MTLRSDFSGVMGWNTWDLRQWEETETNVYITFIKKSAIEKSDE